MLSTVLKQELEHYLKQDLGKKDVTTAIVIEKNCIAKIKANENCVVAGIEEIITPVNETTYTKINKVTPPNTYSTKKYFIIAGSFTEESNAIRLVNKLKNQGFEALIADTNKYGMYRVAFSTCKNRADAENKLLAIRDGSSSDAWLLVK